MYKSELVGACLHYSLPKSGTKEDLLARLEAHIGRDLRTMYGTFSAHLLRGRLCPVAHNEYHPPLFPCQVTRLSRQRGCGCPPVVTWAR